MRVYLKDWYEKGLGMWDSPETAINDLSAHIIRARRAGKNSIKFQVTQKEMDFLVEQAGGDQAKLDILDKHYEVYVQYEVVEEALREDKETAYKKGGPNPPLNRADRRRLRFGKTPKPVVSAKRT